MTSKIVNWCTTDIRPFDTIIGKGFIDFSQELLNIGRRNSSYNVNIHDILPHPTTISRNIDYEYNKALKCIIPEVTKAIMAGKN